MSAKEIILKNNDEKLLTRVHLILLKKLIDKNFE